MFRTLKHHIFRSPYQSLAAILVVSLSLFLISVFFLLGAGSQKVLQYFESRPQVTAFLKDEIKPQEIEIIKTKIQSNPSVKKIDYVSKEDALKIYREQNKDNPLLLEMVTAKILPASLEVSTIDLSSLKSIAGELKKEPMVEDVIFQEDVISALSLWMQTIRKVGIGIAGFLLIVSIMTIIVILGMKISQRKDEIEILKLLGASSWHIRIPLYLEGIIYGIVAAIVSWIISYVSLLYLTPYIVKFLSGVSLLPLSPIFLLEMLGGLIFLGATIGFLGSLVSVSRFMRSIR